MITKYRTQESTYKVDATITPVEVEKETDVSVWIKGHRTQKVTQNDRLHDTWEDAHAHLLGMAERQANAALRRLQQAESDIRAIKGMKKPQ